MKDNPLLQLAERGQSVWLDYTRRDLIESGSLRDLIEGDGLRGMDSNPSILERAIAGTQIYEEDVQTMVLEGQSPKGIYEALSQRDIQGAADELQTVYTMESGGDGFVCLDVNPHLAHETKGTMVEVRRLRRLLDRPNVLFKVPATREGLPAIKQLVSEGINVNVTLLFGLPCYRKVAQAYIEGLETRVALGKSVKGVASVASFFLSPIDSLVDPELEILIEQGGGRADIAKQVRGQVAIASAKMAYQVYKELFESERFGKLAAHGAHAQRLLWASTGAKNPDDNALKYVEPLIGPDTISAVTIETLDAYRDHGKPESRLEQDVKHAAWTMEQLPALGIDIGHVTRQLEEEGVERFNQAFDKLMGALAAKKALVF